MKCKRCSKKITWDNSIGPAENLICYPCFIQESVTQGNNQWKVLQNLFKKEGIK